MKLFSATLILTLLVSNVLTLTSSKFNALLSGGLATISGVETLAQKQEKKARKRKMAIKKHGSNLIKRTVRTGKKSVSSAGVKAIPFFGGAAALTMTALEIQAACENISDMDVIYQEMGVTKEEIVDGVDVRSICNPSIPSIDTLFESSPKEPKIIYIKENMTEDGKVDLKSSQGYLEKTEDENSFVDSVQEYFNDIGSWVRD